MRPIFRSALRDHIDMPVQQQRAAASRASQNTDHIRPALIAALRLHESRMLPQFLYRRLEYIHDHSVLGQRFCHK